jgi:LPS sulfotransferase NodH
MENRLRELFSGPAIIHQATLEQIRQTARLYIVFFTPRSGSTWLADMAHAGQRLGSPGEMFNWEYIQHALQQQPPLQASEINRYVIETVMTYRSPAGITGIKVDYLQAQMLFELLEDGHGAGAGIHLFYLRRRDLIAQAVSAFRSGDTGFYHAYQTDEELIQRFDDLAYSPDRIASWAGHLLNCEVGFEKLFRGCNLQPSRFFYEDMVADPAAIMAWLDASITGEVTEPAPTQQSDGLSTKAVFGAPIKPISDVRNKRWAIAFRNDRPEFIIDLMARRPALVDDFRT